MARRFNLYLRYIKTLSELLLSMRVVWAEFSVCRVVVRLVPDPLLISRSLTRVENSAAE